MNGENAGKLLFECTQTFAWFRGTIENETDKTYLARLPGASVSHRVHKSEAHVLLPAGADPQEAERLYRDAIQSFNEAIREAENAVRALRAKQVDAARAALLKSGSRP